MLIKIMFWYFLLIILVSLCGSFQPIRLKKLPRLCVALKSGEKKFICLYFITTVFYYFNVGNFLTTEIPLIQTDFLFFNFCVKT